MAGRTDGRELWAEVQMVGSTLGETLEQQKRKFFEVLPEEVQAQLVSRYLGEEAVLKLDWKNKMLLEVAFLWKSGKPTLSVLEQPSLTCHIPTLAGSYVWFLEGKIKLGKGANRLCVQPFLEGEYRHFNPKLDDSMEMV